MVVDLLLFTDKRTYNVDIDQGLATSSPRTITYFLVRENKKCHRINYQRNKVIKCKESNHFY